MAPNFAFMIGLSSNFPDKSAYRLIVSLLSNFRALLPQAKLVSAVPIAQENAQAIRSKFVLCPTSSSELICDSSLRGLEYEMMPLVYGTTVPRPDHGIVRGLHV